MKIYFKIISILFFLSYIGTHILAQDFTVTVPLTFDCGDYIVPLKPGATKTFEVKVKNNRTETYTASIRKESMGSVKDWMSFSTTSIAIQPS